MNVSNQLQLKMFSKAMTLGMPVKGRLEGADAAKYLLGGNATFTLVSRNTQQRFTFKLQEPKDKDDSRNCRLPYFLKVLTGADNSNDFTFLGTIWQDRPGVFSYTRSLKSRIGEAAPSAQVAVWLAKHLNVPEKLTEQCEIWHSGRCGRCGRKLTVPTSVFSGFGPECADKMGV